MKTIQLKNKFKKMFKCDKVRITKPLKKIFLIIGFKKNTKDSYGYWYKNGRQVNFSYFEEKIIASGNNKKELVNSAKEYKRLQGITMLDYLKEKCVSTP